MYKGDDCTLFMHLKELLEWFTTETISSLKLFCVALVPIYLYL